MTPCRSCEKEWTFTVLEQALFHEKGYEHDPSRCKPCRDQRKEERGPSNDQRHVATCAECGEDAHVPFVPRPGRPVYCRSCYVLQRRTG